MSNRVVSFGEIMLRLTPPGYERLAQANSLEVTYGGAEANVAVALARLGMDVSYVTKLPKNPLGDRALQELRSHGVDINHVVRGGERLGVYYLERGASIRGSHVLYDRANSAIANASHLEFDWEKIFKDANWFHFTGITPALSDELFNATLAACKIGKEKGLVVSCDVNFRTKLWDRKTASTKLGELLKYVDVCIINEEHAGELFGIRPHSKEIDRDAFNSDIGTYISRGMMEKFPLKKVAITYRRTISANVNRWWATLYDGENIHISKEYLLDIIDRIGSGDAFAGGLIYALLCNRDLQFAVDFGAACCALKHTIEGDFNHVGVGEVIELLESDRQGQVAR